MPTPSRDRLKHKVKNMTGDNDVAFIKQVPIHPRDSVKCLTKNINDDASTINYVVDGNIDALPDSETVNYTDNTTVKTPKKVQSNYRWTKSKKKSENLKWKFNEKNKLTTSIKKKRWWHRFRETSSHACAR